MKKIYSLLCLLLLPLGLLAQPPGYKPVSDTASLNKNIAVKAQSLKTIESDFVQLKNLSVLSEKIESKGVFMFKQQNKLRWEYKTPFNYLVIINDGNIFIKDEHKENRFDMGSNKLFKEINNLMVNSVQGKIGNDKNFKIQAFQNDKYYLIKLTPVSKNLKEFVSHMEIFFDKQDFTVSIINMVEPSGDNTEITFTNKKFNMTLPDEKFAGK